MKRTGFALIELSKIRRGGRQPSTSLRSGGFTLIELLVVVTIIVILLALLLPAMDKAIYQAEMTVCGAQLRSISTSSVSYAAAYKRFFPAPPGGRLPQPPNLGVESTPQQDLRPIVADFIPLKAWLDPLCGEVDLGYEANEVNTVAIASYTYWAGWTYEANHGKGLRKIGDKLHWSDQTSHGAPAHQDQSSILVTDYNGVHANNNQVYISHPDDLGVTVLKEYDNEQEEIVEGTGVGLADITQALWRSKKPVGGVSRPRGLVDLNFAMVDNSVVRYNKISGDWIADNFYAEDGTEFHAAPWSMPGTNTNAKHWMPLR